MFVVGRHSRLIAAFAAAGLMLPPAFAAPGDAKPRPPAIALSLDGVSQFTPAVADPRLAAAFAGRVPLSSDFKFTPAASARRPAQVRVAIRARSGGAGQAARGDAAASADSVGALTATSYNLGVALGWRRFAVSGDVGQVKGGNPALGGREGAAVAVSYSLNRFTGRLSASADRGDGRQAAALPDTQHYALDVGGAYNVSGNLAVTGGVRYKIEHDRLTTLADSRRDGQAVYIGTAFRF